MSTTYIINRWDELYENAYSRKLARPAYLPVPLDLHNLARRDLISTPEGAATFGIFNALIQLGGSMPQRGRLFRDDRAVTPETACALLGAHPETFMAAWNRLLEIKWIIEEPSVPQEVPAREMRNLPQLPETSQQPPKSLPPTSRDDRTVLNCRAGDRTAAVVQGSAGAAASRRAAPNLAAAGKNPASQASGETPPAGGKEHSSTSESTPRLVEVPERAVWEALDRAGIAEPVRTELAHSGLTAADIGKTAAACRGKNKQVGALVQDLRGRARLRAGEIESRARLETARQWLEDHGTAGETEAAAAFRQAYPNIRHYTTKQVLEMPGFLAFVSERLHSRAPPAPHPQGQPGIEHHAA
jgi:hypothetical protein